MFVILGCGLAVPSGSQFITRPPYQVVDTTDLVVESAGIDEILALHRMGELVANLEPWDISELKGYAKKYGTLPLTYVTYKSILHNEKGICKFPLSLDYRYLDNGFSWRLKGAKFNLGVFSVAGAVSIEFNNKTLIMYKYSLRTSDGLKLKTLLNESHFNLELAAIYKVEGFLEMVFDLDTIRPTGGSIHLLTFRLLFNLITRGLEGAFWGKTICWTPDDDERNWGYFADSGDLECSRLLYSNIISKLRRYSV